IGIILGAIVLLLGIGAATIQMKGVPSYENEAPDLSVEATPARLEKGKKLVTMMCAECHKSKNGMMEGKKVLDIPESFGPAYSANITNHPTAGVGRYTDGELAYLLKTGIKKDGQHAPVYMPKWPNMSDEDIYSIIAFLRSDDPLVAASDKPSQVSQPSFFLKLLMNLAIKPHPYKTNIPEPDTSNQVAHGQYLATAVYNCYVCHSAALETANELEPTKTPGFMGGGAQLLNYEGETVAGPNITMDTETGIGSWTEDQFVQAIKYGIRPEGPALKYPMLKLTALTDKEAQAIWAYLQTVPAVNNPGY
ncbi:MAG: cytochrome c, partial [Saprospiraceae bacterium]|nr:cytochrome c [Saprospiraceae bacterium]